MARKARRPSVNQPESTTMTPTSKGELAMVQYLLSVHSTEADPTLSPEVMERMYAQVDMFNQGLKASGNWVFAGGLHPASTATVVNATRSEERRVGKECRSRW